MEQTQKLRQAVKEYKNGKKEAFTSLYEESGRYVYTCIYKVMNGNDNAQDKINDIMQDTYVEISKHIYDLENEEKFLSWAGTIATRKCYAYLKKNKRYVLLNEEDNTFDNLSDSDSIIPEEVMQDKEKQRLVREIIDTQLTDMQKLCIIAYYYNEQKQSDIARELGIPENTVKTNLSRAKAKIKNGVLDLEKNKGTRLYSAAPLLLLLFKEEVTAATVPAEISRNIMCVVSSSGVTAAGTATGKGILSRLASSSLRMKIVCGIMGVGILGGITGVLLQKTEHKNMPAWEIAHREYLEMREENSGFDLNDFDKDGIPELVIHREKDDTHLILVYNERIGGSEIRLGYSNATPKSRKGSCIRGYTAKENEFVVLGERIIMIDSIPYTAPWLEEWYYEDGIFKRKRIVDVYTEYYPDTGKVNYPYEILDTGEVEFSFYEQMDDTGERRELSSEEAKNEKEMLMQKLTDIQYTELEENAIEKRMEEFKWNGNRPRK